MGKFKGRNAVACIPCHSQKVKCNGEAPCERCLQKGRECTYPERKPKLVSVSENYISELERNAGRAQNSESSSGRAASASNTNTGLVFEIMLPESGIALKNTRLDGESSTERFVHQLKELALSEISTSNQTTSSIDYASLHGKHDDTLPDLTIRLPPMPLAINLFEKFEEVFYKQQEMDCLASLVFALASTFMYEQDSHGPNTCTKISTPGADASWETPLPPGFGLFEQARKLLVTFSENPSTEDIEILNLMAFYCYTLNRRKTAFLYTSQSMALAKLLQLDKPSPPLVAESLLRNNENALAIEHRKRLWWTCFLMDRMISAELGLTPTEAIFPADNAPPCSKNISPGDLDQFFDSDLFGLQIRICELKLRVARIENLLRETSEYHDIIIQSLKESLDSLQDFRASIPNYMSLDFSKESSAAIFNLPWSRGIATLYLRYHQCYAALLRPVYYNHLVLALKSAPRPELSPVVSRLMEEGLHAARSNCQIILDLFQRGRNARYGYWDSAHLFSGLIILSLSRIIIKVHDHDELLGSDNSLYNTCRSILHGMASAGNPSAKDHLSHLADVESIVDMLMSGHNVMVDESDNLLLFWANFEVNETMEDDIWPDVNWNGPS
uniref:Zn(2)-C6 fungal-type domain-containing protein n=1 Tax=Bionectria ochroleuca TaxID=29856 RepID=A0A8H7K8L2_BIOOC